MGKLWIPVAAVVSALIVLLGFLLGVSPQLIAMSNANEQREAVEADNAAHEARLAQLKADFERLDEHRAELEELQKELPPGDELRTFLGQLDRLEAASGVTLVRFSASEGQPYAPAPEALVTHPSVTGENLIVLTVELEVTGTRPQVIEFVDRVQRNDRIYLINRLKITEEEEGGAKYSGTLTGYLYVLVDPSAPPPSPTAPGSLDRDDTQSTAQQ